jgi:hypothetical protein
MTGHAIKCEFCKLYVQITSVFYCPLDKVHAMCRECRESYLASTQQDVFECPCVVKKLKVNHASIWEELESINQHDPRRIGEFDPQSQS